MSERRAYDRIKLVLPATILTKQSNCEVLCDIVDISKEGMRIRVSSEMFARLKIRRNDIFQFQFIDKYYVGQHPVESIITDDAKVVYIQNGFGFHELGCYIKSETYADYVTYKKMLQKVEVLND